MQIPTEKLSESRNLPIKRKNYTTEDHLETKKQRIEGSLNCEPISFNSVSDTRYRWKCNQQKETLREETTQKNMEKPVWHESSVYNKPTEAKTGVEQRDYQSTFPKSSNQLFCEHNIRYDMKKPQKHHTENSKTFKSSSEMHQHNLGQQHDLRTVIQKKQNDPNMNLINSNIDLLKTSQTSHEIPLNQQSDARHVDLRTVLNTWKERKINGPSVHGMERKYLPTMIDNQQSAGRPVDLRTVLNTWKGNETFEPNYHEMLRNCPPTMIDFNPQYRSERVHCRDYRSNEQWLAVNNPASHCQTFNIHDARARPWRGRNDALSHRRR